VAASSGPILKAPGSAGGYLPACKRILDQVDEAESQAAGEHSVPRGTLTITAPIAFGRLHVVPVVNAFLAEFPQINISLTL
jgi:DNA-binding transcriptional LysR family regulator